MADSSFQWEHVVYRLRDDEGALLYVGITNDIRRRFSQHQKDSKWWSQVVACQVEFHPTRDAAADAEYEAIRDEFPLYNEREFRSVHPIPRRQAARPSIEGTPRPIKRLTEARPACVYAPGQKIPLRQQMSQDEWDWMHGLGEHAGFKS